MIIIIDAYAEYRTDAPGLYPFLWEIADKKIRTKRRKIGNYGEILSTVMK
jgi:hypothetical protein